MRSVVRKVVSGLSSQGPQYLRTAIRNELAQPRLAATQALRRAAIAIADGLRHRVSSNQPNRLRFFYDLEVAPLTFDFASYLAAVEVERRQRDLEDIEVVFVPSRDGGVRKELAQYDSVVNADSRGWRIRNLLVPILALVPSVTAYRICATREEAAALLDESVERIAPPDYRVSLPRYPAKRWIHERAASGAAVFPMFRAPPHARRIVRDYLHKVAGGRRPVVITMREYGYTPARNSKTEAWLAFADQLDPARYVAIFVPDTEAAMAANCSQYGAHPLYEPAAWNIEVRMALYEAAWLNMAVMQGPMELCWYGEDVRYLIFLNVGNSAVSTAESIAESGQPLYRDLAFAKPFQRIIWDDDKLPVLTGSFAEMAARLEARGETR